MPVLPSRSWNGDGGSNLGARTGLTIHLEGAAEGLDPLPHARQAQRPRLAIPLAARDGKPWPSPAMTTLS